MRTTTGDHDRDDRYAGTELVWSANRQPVRRLRTGPADPGTALDMACGEGRNAIWLANEGWTVTGADFSAIALDKATGPSRSARRAGHVPGDVDAG